MKNENVSFRLCAKNSCCPVVNIKDGHVYISDDFGGRIQITEDELDLLVEERLKMKQGE